MLNNVFTQNPDEGDRQFIAKLHDQLKPCPAAVKQLAAEIMWLFGRSKARLRWWIVGGSGRGCCHGSNVPRSIRGDRRTFWPRPWDRQ
jgi:hypothetical protein